MKEFVVYRHGWNEQNQDPARGLPERMPVARLQAESAEEACRQAAPGITLFPNQSLSAEPAAEVDARVQNLDLQVEALEGPP